MLDNIDTMTFNQNSSVQKRDRNDYQPWAKGFMTKRHGREFHPYTHKDFKFESNK